MKIEQLKTVCVVGGGLMGRQIALNTAIHGYQTNLTDTYPEVLEKVNTWAVEYMNGRVTKGRITREEADSALGRFHLIPTLEQAAVDAQLVIEAIIEEKSIKREFFMNLNKVVSKDTVIATNSSYMVSSTFKDCVDNPSRLANLHYFNPVLVLKLTEVVQGEHVSDETAQFLIEFARKTGKTPIHLRKEVDGFVVNRILRALKDEAFWLVSEKICTPQEVDMGVELGLSHPMGPFRLNDLTGIDLTYNLYERRLQETGIKPAGYDIIKEKYDAHEWGRKTGKGFYDYTDAK